jgi:SAM-dependent methyltransferase
MTAKSTAEIAADQAAFWNGPGGERWLAAYGRIQRSLAGFSREALTAAAASPGEHVIDVGCGTGATTAELARAVGPTGHVLGIDISETLLAAARAHRVDNATFVLGDAATHPFRPQSYDLVFSRLGVMFFAGPVPAFRNFRQALKSGGRLVFICWRAPSENPWWLLPVRAAQPFLPPLPRPGPEDPGPFAFADRHRIERILKEAGFTGARIAPVDLPAFLGPSVGEIIEGATRFGPLATPFAEADPAVAAEAKAAIAAALEPHLTPDGISLPGACWLVRATLH